MENILTTLHTERLTLRQPQQKDAEAITAIVNDPEIARNTLSIPHPYHVDDANRFIAQVIDKSRKTPPNDYGFGIWRTADDVFMGMCGIHLRREHKRAEIGYWLGRDYRGNGYTTEAAQALVRFGFETLGLFRIQAGYFSWNIASRRVQEKAGLQYEGTLRGYVVKDGKSIDLGMCGITRTDWE